MQIEPLKTWPDVEDQTKAWINQYVPANRPVEEKLIHCLHVFLQWLPEGGGEFIARDARDAETDDALREVS